LIDKREILELAREFGLAANVVEKDYVVLGWARGEKAIREGRTLSHPTAKRRMKRWLV
jgi:hypothetical protein